ncbi:hypothetical protein PV416_26590 [Streptomyces ipomoeae]|nr:hypothetical protein [Streptomyces ipomoeae]MDX2824569.1 hypothetical protein [Streptomyces ipomoeae]MDX2931500.1 hypothetical protein [Streptomyces ipomoeae]
MTASGTGRELRAVRPERSRRALVAGSVGTFVEWYAFGVHGS